MWLATADSFASLFLCKPLQAIDNLRGSSSNGKEDPRQEELRVDIARLDEQEQRQSNNGISDHGHEAHTQTVGYNAPDGTCDQGHDLVHETEGAHDIAHAIMDAYQIRDNKGDAAVEEDQEGDGEQRYAEQVADCLQGRRRLGEREVSHQDVARHGGWGFGLLSSGWMMGSGVVDEGQAVHIAQKQQNQQIEDTDAYY